MERVVARGFGAVGHFVLVCRVEHFEKGGEVLFDAFQPEEVALARGVGHHGLQHLCCAVPVYGEYLRPFGDGPVDAADYLQLAGGNDLHAHRQQEPQQTLFDMDDDEDFSYEPEDYDGDELSEAEPEMDENDPFYLSEGMHL